MHRYISAQAYRVLSCNRKSGAQPNPAISQRIVVQRGIRYGAHADAAACCYHEFTVSCALARWHPDRQPIAQAHRAVAQQGN